MRVMCLALSMLACLALPSQAQTAGAVYAELGGMLIPAWFVGGVFGVNKLIGGGITVSFLGSA